MQRKEEQFNTLEQVRGYLTDALNLVAELDPPTDLREVTFNQACGLLAAKQVFFEQPAQMLLDPRMLKGH